MDIQTGGGFADANARLLMLLSAYLNQAPDFVQPEAVQEMVHGCGLDTAAAFSMLLAAGCGLDIADNPEDRKLYHDYFPDMVRRLDAAAYRADAYYAHIRLPNAASGRCTLATEAYKPYEAFVYNDFMTMPDGRMIPQIGFFEEGFAYPAIFESGRVWMTVTPNEIETMRAPIAHSRGSVLALGLGLGYFAYMTSEKSDVSMVTVVEQSPDVIRLFTKHILPQFEHADKIHIVQGDAFAYMQAQLAQGGFDTVFADLWHDVSDGLEMYLRLKEFEKDAPGARFDYWIEKSIRCYL